MKISIITVCYNAVTTIHDTIRSVANQSYRDIEYIIIDGNSTDGTLDIIQSYQDSVNCLISEPDRGIYDAMNKGIDRATGDIVAILNSDDYYCNSHVLKKVVDCFTMGRIDACYGDIDYVGRDDSKQVVRRWKSGEYREAKLHSGWIPPHPAFFVKRSLYTQLGGYRTDFSIAADYEWMLRSILKRNMQMSYIHEPLVSMRSGGHSAINIAQRIRGWKELRRAWVVNEKKVPTFFISRRIISKIYQYL